VSDTHEVMTTLILLSVVLKFSWQSHLYISVCVCDVGKLQYCNVDHVSMGG
jgi:hypothetical protein